MYSTVDSGLTYTYDAAVAEAWRLARSTATWEYPGSNLTADDCVYRDSIAIYSLGHGLRKFTAGLRSTRPCLFSGPLNWVPASAGVKAGMSPLLWYVYGSCDEACCELLYPVNLLHGRIYAQNTETCEISHVPKHYYYFLHTLSS